MSTEHRFLIIDGYPRESREQFDDVGMRQAFVLYRDLVRRYLPAAVLDAWYPSDPGATAPTRDDLARYTAVLWPGCNQTVYHDKPNVKAMVELTRLVYEVGRPSFGSCWGLQLAAYAAGGLVELHPRGREMGIGRNNALTETGLTHPMMAGKPPVYAVFQSHDDEVTSLPAGSEILAGNAWSRIQAAVINHGSGTFWAVQYHPEYDLHEMARLIVAREERLLKQGLFQDHDDLMAYVDRLEALYIEPDRTDLRWQLGIDDDLLDDDLREREFRNFLKYELRVL